MKKISQREARSLRKRVELLEREQAQKENAWAHEWPGGVHLCTVPVAEVLDAQVRTARKLGHAVVALLRDGNNIAFYACNLRE